MQKTMKRTLALILAVALCLSGLPLTVFAAEVPPEPESMISSEVSQEAGPAPSAVITPEPSEEPAPTSPPETADTVEPSPKPDNSELTPGTELPITQIWPAPKRKARSASFGTNGTLYMGDECCPGGVGTPPTLGEYIGTMSVITMKYGGKHVAGYCLEHVRFVP